MRNKKSTKAKVGPLDAGLKRIHDRCTRGPIKIY